MIKLLVSFLLFSSLTASNLKSLYNSLDPLSTTQHLAFYELYKDTPEGKQALARAWTLLSGKASISHLPDLFLPKFDLEAIISLATRQSFDPPVILAQEQLDIIDQLSTSFGNRQLKGFHIKSKEALLALPSEEIDLARGLLLNQFETEDEILQYEASLDLMALQIRARLSVHPSHEEKLREINRFIFQEMQFRFPPHSLHAKDIDLYTFLPSVLDSRQGVCLGVSILYLSLAQRLDLPLEIITPPGHIYVRYPAPLKEINIETTARGVNLPTDTYLGINTRKLNVRSLKEVIGMAFINQASVAWSQQNFKKTVELYEKAQPYLPDDPLLNMFLGFNYLFVGKKQRGRQLLETVRHFTFDEAVSAETMPDDYFNGRIDIEGIKAVFLPVDETYDSVIAKQQTLQKILKRHPKFRAGMLQLAITWLQLGRGSEALDILEQYHKIDPHDATVEYYLAVLCMERFDYRKAWSFLKNAETLAAARDHHPKALKGLRQALKRVSPDS
jgi:regulator of sirC expression with transglutaminase-like and TPR domain